MRERLVQEVLRLKVVHVLAHHDCPWTAGERIGVAHHPAQRLQIQPGRLGEVHGLTRRGV